MNHQPPHPHAHPGPQGPPGPYGHQPPVDPQGRPPMQPRPAGPMGMLAFTLQGSVLTSSMILPEVRLNGHRIQVRYGRQDIPVPAGPVHVEASTQWMRTYGQAALDVTVAPGQLVPVFYATPWHQFTTGSMGHQEQQRKGLGGFLAIIGGTVLLVVILVVAGILAAM